MPDLAPIHGMLVHPPFTDLPHGITLSKRMNYRVMEDQPTWSLDIKNGCRTTAASSRCRSTAKSLLDRLRPRLTHNVDPAITGTVVITIPAQKRTPKPVAAPPPPPSPSAPSVRVKPLSVPSPDGQVTAGAKTPASADSIASAPLAGAVEPPQSGDSTRTDTEVAEVLMMDVDSCMKVEDEDEDMVEDEEERLHPPISVGELAESMFGVENSHPDAVSVWSRPLRAMLPVFSPSVCPDVALQSSEACSRKPSVDPSPEVVRATTPQATKGPVEEVTPTLGRFEPSSLAYLTDRDLSLEAASARTLDSGMLSPWSVPVGLRQIQPMSGAQTLAVSPAVTKWMSFTWDGKEYTVVRGLAIDTHEERPGSAGGTNRDVSIRMSSRDQPNSAKASHKTELNTLHRKPRAKHPISRLATFKVELASQKIEVHRHLQFNGPNLQDKNCEALRATVKFLFGPGPKSILDDDASAGSAQEFIPEHLSASSLGFFFFSKLDLVRYAVLWVALIRMESTTNVASVKHHHRRVAVVPLHLRTDNLVRPGKRERETDGWEVWNGEGGQTRGDRGNGDAKLKMKRRSDAPGCRWFLQVVPSFCSLGSALPFAQFASQGTRIPGKRLDKHIETNRTPEAGRDGAKAIEEEESGWSWGWEG
ncbi:hypothetical protein C8R47DRAFT_1255684 [Mycena vitilis]|nr:hypothetical protein C8R47DRAFT_1255684 [Mycena vitilis]